MRGSLKLFTWFGIPVHLHWTFGFILLYAFYLGATEGNGLWSIAWFVGLFASLFTCVLLHEYGHSLTARRYGVETQDIILTPIGGIARLERMPEKPRQEFVVAIAGPLVNVVIAFVLILASKILLKPELWELVFWTIKQYFQPMLDFLGSLFTADWDALWAQFNGESSMPEQTEEMSDIVDGFGLSDNSLLFYLPILIVINLMLVLFNLVPAFPMDGGRIFRALLAMRIGRPRATRVAAIVGQVIAGIFVLYGLLTGQITLALIGFFVFSTARTENSMVQLDALLNRFKAKDLVRPQFTRLSMNDWMQTPIALLRQGLERHFLVFDLHDRLVGTLDEADIVAAIKKRDLSAEIAGYAREPVEIVRPEESLQYVYHVLQQRRQGIVAVADEQGIVGVIDQEGLRHFLRMQTL